MNWWEPYVSFEINPNLKTTFPWRTPWRTSPSISPPFFRPIRTFNIYSPRIHSHNSLQLWCCHFFPVIYTPDLQVVRFWRCQWWSCHDILRDDYILLISINLLDNDWLIIMLSLPDGHERVFLDAKAFVTSYSRSALNLSPCHLKREKCFTFTFTFLMFSLKCNTQLLPQVLNKVTTRWEGPQSLSYQKYSLSKDGLLCTDSCVIAFVKANRHTWPEQK